MLLPRLGPVANGRPFLKAHAATAREAHTPPGQGESAGDRRIPGDDRRRIVPLTNAPP